ncbi:MAG TPA: hypothetical protein VD926_02295, partial [Acidimicrobiales bacterium]|nr:hypothetical protein [Acidimicrobiales bacterium]
GSPINTATLGWKQFTVTARDAAGNQVVVTHTYRVTDVVDPVVELRRPLEGAVFARGEVVEADYACEDETGGSGVASCIGTVVSGAAIDTSVLGRHAFSVTGTDNAGNSTTVTHHYTVVDRTSPTVDIASPVDGEVYARGALVRAAYTCADEVGGSGLRPFGSCTGPVAIGDPVDTWTLGVRPFRVTAADDAGNVGWATSTYTVVENQPDGLIREASSTAFAGDDVYGTRGVRQTVHAETTRRRNAVFVLRVQNDTSVTDRFRIQGVGSRGAWSVRWFANGQEVTRAVARGNYVVGPLEPGQSRALQLVVRPLARAEVGDQLIVPLTSSGMAPDPVRDRVRAVVRVR